MPRRHGQRCSVITLPPQGTAFGPPIPNLVEIHALGASGQMGEILQKLLFFSLISRQVRPVDGFLRAIAQKT